MYFKIVPADELTDTQLEKVHNELIDVCSKYGLYIFNIEE